MNILVVTDLYPGPDVEDPAVFALHRFCRQWARHHDVRVLRPYCVPNWRRRPLPAARAWRLEGVEVVSLPVPKFPGRPWFFLRSLYRAAQGIQTDVVAGHLGFNLLFAARLARRKRVPLVAAVHMGDLVRGPRMLGKERLGKIFHQAERLAPRSPAVRRRLLADYPELRSRCRTAWSGQDSSVSASDDAATRLDRPAWGEPLRLVTACSLVPLKNVDVTLWALARLESSRKWTFTVAGDGPERGVVEKLALELGVRRHVRFAGWMEREALQNELAGSHLFVMVSAPETFGLAYLEAMAAGCLVVGAKKNGVDGVVVHRRNGWLCPAGDADALAALFREIFAMGEKELLRMRGNSLRTVSLLTEEKAADNYMQILQQAIECGGGIS